VACNESSADYMLSSALLDQAHDYRIPDYSAYLAARS
jgi:methylglyoxal synthase